MSNVAQTSVAAREHPEVVMVDCGVSRGSAFRIGRDILLTVAHVTSHRSCTIYGKPVKVLRAQGDFAIITTTPSDDRWMRIDCGGFVKGRKYLAVGYARGLSTLTVVEIEATGKTKEGLAQLWGVFTVVPGQSGGPIIDKETGRPVGTVNTYDDTVGLSGSVELKQTEVCRHA
jgi:hypothetical protein